MTQTSQPIEGWGRYPRYPCRLRREDSASALQAAIAETASGSFIARGLGRSYGDAAMLRPGTVLDQTGRIRLLGFDAQSGVLHCEAGISLADIITVFLPRGWFLPTTPGTKFVTVGGAIAADVHGKNHHVDGSFGAWVCGLELLLASGEIVECGPDHDPDLFWATIGGMGLTGVILSASVQLRRTQSAFCELTVRRTADLDSTMALLQDQEAKHRYSVAWIDALARGKRLGRSVVMFGDDADPDRLPAPLRADPLQVPRRTSFRAPFTAPGGLFRPWTVRAFNRLYYASHRDRQGFVDYDSFFYPLDGIGRWNLLYGPRGFLQYQALFPISTAKSGLRALLEHVSTQGFAASLGVLKGSGEAGKGVLSFLHSGYTLALDIAHPGRRLPDLSRALDEIVLRFGGRVYLAKDAITSAEAFASMYPALDRFREIKARIDPGLRFTSAQAQRLRIVET